jgi:glucose dehydrogenase
MISRRTFLDGGRILTAAALLDRLWPQQAVRAAALPQPGLADWTRYGHDLHNTRFNAAERTLGVANVGKLKVKWQFATEDGWPIQSTPAVIGDTLFFGAGRFF